MEALNRQIHDPSSPETVSHASVLLKDAPRGLSQETWSGDAEMQSGDLVRRYSRGLQPKAASGEGGTSATGA